MINLTNSEKYEIRKAAMKANLDDDYALTAIWWLVNNDVWEGWDTIEQAIKLFDQKTQAVLDEIKLGRIELGDFDFSVD